MRAAAGVFVLLLALAAAASAPRADAAVYWVNNDGFDAGTIGRVNLNGTGFDPDFISGLANPWGVTVDDRHIYWGSRFPAHSIGRANLDGSDVNRSFISGGLVSPGGPSVNDQYIYWANNLGPGTGTIGRANIDGSGVSANNISGSAVHGPHSTAIEGGFVYWTNTSGPSNEGSIYRQEIDVGPPQPVTTGISPVFTPIWPSLSPTRVFWAAYTFGVASSDRDGNNGATVTASNAAGGTAVLGNKIYWLSRPDGNLSRANFDGSSPQFALVTGLENPLGLALDGRSFPPFGLGAVRRKKRRGTATMLLTLPEPGKLVLRGRGVRRRTLRAPEGRFKLLIRPNRRARQKLENRGRARVRAKITHTPDGGEPGTRVERIRLIQL